MPRNRNPSAPTSQCAFSEHCSRQPHEGLPPTLAARQGLTQDHPAGLWLHQNLNLNIFYSLGILAFQYPLIQASQHSGRLGCLVAYVLVNLEHTCYSAAMSLYCARYWR